ncbi:MAG: TonB-dependent receptor [Ignavibacteriales bacterium]|nr:TonB-dependent receptor [Ignavibacteriales bacterium]
MKKIFLLCFLFSISAFAQNAGKIAGRIIDAKNKEPLPFANIVIRGTSLGTSSDADGNFFILNVPPGVYDLAASLIGFRGVVQQEVIVSVSRTTTINFSMLETLVQSQEVVVTATRPDVEREKSSTSEIRRGEDVVNVPGIQDISDVLALNADVSDGHFRGGRDNEELYNLQGMGIMNPFSSASAFNPIMSAVEEVEVITSGFSAQYGNAQSGIVNITMKEGRADRWTGRGEVRMRAPGLKHFGPSLWDPAANPYIPMLSTLDKWLGPNGYWGAVGSGYANRLGKDTLALASLMWSQWLKQAHRNIGKNYDNLLDYSLDANVGGPLASNVRLFLAFHTDNNWPILPTTEPNVSRQLMGNLVYDVGNGINLRLSGAFSRADGHTFSGKNTTGWYNWVWDPEFNIKLTTDENMQLGLRWSQALSKSTFYEIKLNTLQTKSIDGSPAYNPDFYAGVAPALIWEAWSNNLPDGFNFGQLENDFVSEKTSTTSLDASITSQVSVSHMILAGIQANLYSIDVDNETSLNNTTGGGNLSQYVFKPYEAGVYIQDKMEFEGMIANIGLRLDIYNPNMTYYTDLFAPYRYTDSLGLQRIDEKYAPTAKTSAVARLQPRAGFSFPVSVSTVFHVNYGTFLQRPPFERLMTRSLSRSDLLKYGTSLTVNGILGNPRLKPEVTSSYDIGVTQGVGEGFTLDVSGYYKDVSDLLQRAVYSSKQGSYTTYINLDYADIRGFRLGLAKRSGMVTGSLNYTYGVATGKNASPDGNQYPTIYESGESKEPVPQDILMDFDRTNNLVANLGVNTPREWGPMLFEAYPLEQITIAATSFARSGRPYSSWLNRGTLMNKRSPSEYNTNLKITKQVQHFFGTSASFYVEVSNLFNNKIYDYTAVFNPDQNNTANLQKWTIKYEKGEDITYYEDDLRPGFLINQEFRIYSNMPRSVQFGMIVNL